MQSLLHFCRFIAGLDQPYSQLTEEELSVLLKYASGAKVAVEIGCLEGRTCAALARVVQGKIYSIDIFRKGRLGVCYAEWIAKIHRSRQGITNLELIKGRSEEVADGFHEPIDFLFVDADHSYEGVRHDWDKWATKVRAGGIVALHDCRLAKSSRHYLGSMQFYEQDIPRISWVWEIDAVDALAVFRVNPEREGGTFCISEPQAVCQR